MRPVEQHEFDPLTRLLVVTPSSYHWPTSDEHQRLIWSVDPRGSLGRGTGCQAGRRRRQRDRRAAGPRHLREVRPLRGVIAGTSTTCSWNRSSAVRVPSKRCSPRSTPCAKRDLVDRLVDDRGRQLSGTRRLRPVGQPPDVDHLRHDTDREWCRRDVGDGVNSTHVAPTEAQRR